MPLPIRYHYAMLREMIEDTLKLEKEKKGLLFSLSISAAFDLIRHIIFCSANIDLLGYGNLYSHGVCLPYFTSNTATKNNAL